MLLITPLLLALATTVMLCEADGERRSRHGLRRAHGNSMATSPIVSPSLRRNGARAHALRNREHGMHRRMQHGRHHARRRHRIAAVAGRPRLPKIDAKLEPSSTSFRHRAFQQTAYELQMSNNVYPGPEIKSENKTETNNKTESLSPFRTPADDQTCIPDYLAQRFSKEKGVHVNMGEMLCPNKKLAAMVADTYDVVRAEHPERVCNVVTANKRIQDDLKDAFGYTFDSVIAYGDFASKSHMSQADLFCKMKHDDKYIMVFATQSTETIEKYAADQQSGGSAAGNATSDADTGYGSSKPRYKALKSCDELTTTAASYQDGISRTTQAANPYGEQSSTTTQAYDAGTTTTVAQAYAVETTTTQAYDAGTTTTLAQAYAVETTTTVQAYGVETTTKAPTYEVGTTSSAAAYPNSVTPQPAVYPNIDITQSTIASGYGNSDTTNSATTTAQQYIANGAGYLVARGVITHSNDSKASTP